MYKDFILYYYHLSIKCHVTHILLSFVDHVQQCILFIFQSKQSEVMSFLTDSWLFFNKPSC